MGVKRIVDTDFWSDTKVLDKYTPEDKYFLLYLLTNPHTKQCGIYRLPKKYINFETGYNTDTVNGLLDRFEKVHKNIIYDHNTQEIAILNYLKYSIIKGGKPVYDCITADLEKVKNKNLIRTVYEHLDEFFRTSTKQSYKAIEQIFKEKINLYLGDNDNDNDNDNDSIVNDSCNDSLPTSPTTTLDKKDIDTIINTWNTLGLQQLQAINSNTKRHTMLKARIGEYTLGTVLGAIESIDKSQFLKGQNNRGWTITFDWFVKPNNFLKVLEGNYIDKKGDSKDGTYRQSDRDDFEQYRDIGIKL